MSQTGSASEPSTSTCTYLVRHCDPNSTGEGLGSHARGTLYPLLRVQETLGWEILWQPSEQPCWSAEGNTTRPEYETECQHLGAWLGFKRRFEDLDRNTLTVVNIDLDVDPRLGRILGSVQILMDSIRQYIDEHGADKFYCRMPQRASKQASPITILVSLNGRFQYRDDPTLPVVNWMQERALSWREKALSSRKPGTLEIVGHIRVPEDYCSAEWKAANSIDHLLDSLSSVHDILSDLDSTKSLTHVALDIFTEACFSGSEEERLRNTISNSWQLLTEKDTTASTKDQSNTNISISLTLHRQTPLLACVESMASADIFIPASSFLSAFASFFHVSLVVLPNEATRHDKYFAPHLKYAKWNPKASPQVEENAAAGTQRDKEETQIPLVQVEQPDALRQAISEVLQNRE